MKYTTPSPGASIYKQVSSSAYVLLISTSVAFAWWLECIKFLLDRNKPSRNSNQSNERRWKFLFKEAKCEFQCNGLVLIIQNNRKMSTGKPSSTYLADFDIFSVYIMWSRTLETFCNALWIVPCNTLTCEFVHYMAQSLVPYCQNVMEVWHKINIHNVPLLNIRLLFSELMLSMKLLYRLNDV